jgi:hypothetical protein
MPYFKQWADCFCRHLPDFGIRVNSRAEGAHHRFKSVLLLALKATYFMSLRTSIL